MDYTELSKKFEDTLGDICDMDDPQWEDIEGRVTDFAKELVGNVTNNVMFSLASSNGVHYERAYYDEDGDEEDIGPTIHCDSIYTILYEDMDKMASELFITDVLCMIFCGDDIGYYIEEAA